MADWTNATPPTGGATPPRTATSSGILRPDELARYVRLDRFPAPPDCSAWVETLWGLTWELPPGASYTSRTLPHPACHLSVERGRLRAGVTAPAVVNGVVTKRFDVELVDRGYVVAAKFRPGGLAALTGVSARRLRDRVVPADSLLPAEAIAGLAPITDDVPVRVGVATIAACVASLGAAHVTRAAGRQADTRHDDGRPQPGLESAGGDARYGLLLRLVGQMLTDRSLQQVGQVAERGGLSVRSLQRLFDHYVGVSPKWVLARYRMHDAVSDLDAGYDGPLADLAASLGWFDQAHFTRDFVALVGTTPGAYRARADAADEDGSSADARIEAPGGGVDDLGRPGPTRAGHGPVPASP